MYAECNESCLLRSSFSQRSLWESPRGSLNYAAEVIPMGQLCYQYLTVEGSRAYLVVDWDCLVPMLGCIRLLIQEWMVLDFLNRELLRGFFPPSVFVAKDASCPAREFQSPTSTRGTVAGLSPHPCQRDVGGVAVPPAVPSLEGVSVCFHMDNQMVVRSMNCQAPSPVAGI